MKKPDDPSSSATMQIDVSDLEPRPPSVPPSSRAAPPPLPPQVAAPAPAAPATNPGKMAIYGALFLAFLAAAIFGGMKVGLALRGPAPAASAAPSIVTANAVPSPTPSPSPAILSIPTVEVTGQRDAQ